MRDQIELVLHSKNVFGYTLHHVDSLPLAPYYNLSDVCRQRIRSANNSATVTFYPDGWWEA